MIELISGFNGYGKVYFQILTQTEQNIHFACSNGWIIETMNCPEINHKDKILFVRGTNKEKDNKRLVTSLEIFKEIQEAIREYNKCINQHVEQKKKKNMIMEITFTDKDKIRTVSTFLVPKDAKYFNGEFSNSEEDIFVTIPKKTVKKYLWKVGDLWFTKEHFTKEEIQKRSNMIMIEAVEGSMIEVDA